MSELSSADATMILQSVRDLQDRVHRLLVLAGQKPPQQPRRPSAAGSRDTILAAISALRRNIDLLAGGRPTADAEEEKALRGVPEGWDTAPRWFGE